ncbi:MAG: DUF3592 domain-containing protein [Salinibacter sp.]
MSSNISIGSIGGDGSPSGRKVLLILVVGVAVMGYGGYDYARQSSAIATAVEVTATITDMGVETVPQRRGGPDYRPEVAFEYQYRGTRYTGTNLYPANTESNYDTESAARSAIETYEEGETRTAYVDPDAPSEGFLTDRRSTAPLKLIGVGALFVVLGIGAYVKS